MRDMGVAERDDLVCTAERAFQSETEPVALQAVAARLRDADPDHPLLLLLDTKIVAVLIGVQPGAARTRPDVVEPAPQTSPREGTS